MQEYIDELYELPSIDKFRRIKKDGTIDETDIKTQQLIIDIFKSFGVEVLPADIYRSPRKIRIEFYLARGKRISACKRLEPDLALHTRIHELKIVAPVLGKATIAIEIPRDSTDTLPIGNGLALYDKYNAKGKLVGFLGVNVEGHPVCIDFSDSPHLMLLGTTGSGKSIALQGILMSLLLKYDPSQLSIFLASAYGATFPVFRKIPHLYGSIAQSFKSLKYNLINIKKEIEKRLLLLKTTQTTNLNTYNSSILEHKHTIEQIINNLKTVCSATSLEDKLIFLKNRVQDLLLLNKTNKTKHVHLPKIVCFIDDVNHLMPIEDSGIYQILTYILRHGPTVGISVILSAQTSIFTRTYPDLLANVKHRAVFSTKEAESKKFLDVQGASTLPAYGVCLFQAKGKDIQEVQTCNITNRDCYTMAFHWSRYTKSR